MAINVSVQYNGGLLPDIILFCFLFFVFLRTSSARGGEGGGAARLFLFLFLFFPVQQTTSGIGHRVK